MRGSMLLVNTLCTGTASDRLDRVLLLLVVREVALLLVLNDLLLVLPELPL